MYVLRVYAVCTFIVCLSVLQIDNIVVEKERKNTYIFTNRFGNNRLTR